jgi:pyrroloquinoline quinone biosynthesis protein B
VTPQNYAACLGLIDSRQKPAGVWLIDATPDIKYQLNHLADELGPHSSRPNRLRQPNGIFLTHAHMGHTVGLAQLGPEGMNVESLPIYAFPELLEVIGETKLWSPLINNLQPTPIRPYERIRLAHDLTIKPIPVPHRDELGSGTAAYLVDGPERSLLYLPDIDNWRQWKQAEKVLQGVDVLLADGTFFSNEELSGRPSVAHPLIPETLTALAGKRFQLVLIHFNHTNPILDKSSEARNLVTGNDVLIAQTGQWFNL